MIWNAQTIDDLRTLWAEGHSTAEIGRRLGFSKNAIVGKSHRLELEPHESPIRRGGAPIAAPIPAAPKNTLPPLPSSFRPEITEEQERRVLYFSEASEAQCAALVGVSRYAVAAVRERQRRAQGVDPVADVPEITPAILAPEPRMPDPIPAPAPRAAVTHRRRETPECCWPIGEPGTKTFRFCDSASLLGKPYCDEHARLAYVKIRPRGEEDAAPELMAAE